jgi:LmbE family N-acetylglucosaminyl deacetylase
MLLRLGTTARLVHIDAHPDDEDGGMLTLESRGKGVAVVLLTLNRGEGGQNKVGSNLFDVLGVLRTLELTAADRYYGVEQRFSRVTDFGFSKTSDETFEKWQGHDVALADMVAVIRRFRPQVMVSRFSGTERDGHGNHQAAGILSREAFRAAADPARFPEQIRQGLRPWQASKLYMGNVCGFAASTCPAENYTVKLNTGQMNPALGMSYAQFAMQGLKHQLSQGAGSWSIEPGDRFTYYQLVDSVPSSPLKPGTQETDFFDGIDTSLVGLASGLGAEESQLPWLRPELGLLARELQEASAASAENASAAIEPLSRMLARLHSTIERASSTDLSPAPEDLLASLRDKQQEAERALGLALELSLEARVELSRGKPAERGQAEDSQAVISPGQTAEVNIEFHNASRLPLRLQSVSLDAANSGRPASLPSSPGSLVEPGERFRSRIELKVPDGFEYTRPYWHRANPETDSLNTVDQPNYATLPFPPPPFLARAVYLVPGSGSDHPIYASIAAPLVVAAAQDGSLRRRALAVAPLFSLSLEPGEQILPLNRDAANPLMVKLALRSNAGSEAKGELHLKVPPFWRVEPPVLPVDCRYRGQTQDFEFRVFPAKVEEGRVEIGAVFDSGGAQYSEGYSLVSRSDLDAFYYYQPAVQRVSMVDVRVPSRIKVAYVMGAGDDIPTVLEQMGVEVTLLSAGEISKTKLDAYGTIVLGIRAYDTETELVANNPKLLDYVFRGGTLVVQYNAAVNDFNQAHLTPYPAELSRDRVSVEQAPVEILAPADSVFHSPNEIGLRDFDGWVQERGLYFWSRWDNHFQPLLASHDPGEAPQKGGLLRASYGKGTYLYTGYAFFRQLPAGVPGAIRLYANLLAAGH